jgi:hypothetical protein
MAARLSRPESHCSAEMDLVEVEVEVEILRKSLVVWIEAGS